MKRIMRRASRVFSALILLSCIVVTTSCNNGNSEVMAEGEVCDIVTSRCIGSTVTFGTYEQDGNKSNGKEPIEWNVLDIDPNGKWAILISKYTLDCEQYDKYKGSGASWKDKGSTWEDCELRKWLNDDFLNKAFTKDEQLYISTTTVTNPGNDFFETSDVNETQDRIYALSLEEIEKYYSNIYYGEDNHYLECQELIAEATPYAVKQGVEESVIDEQLAESLIEDGYDNSVLGKSGSRWWLRNGVSSDASAFCVEAWGLAGRGNQSWGNVGVRPVLKIEYEDSPGRMVDSLYLDPVEGTESEESLPVDADTDNEAVVEETTVVDNESSNVSFNWIEGKNIVEDNDGYRYEISVKISPWIFSSNEQILQDAWNEVGKGNTLPRFNDIRFPITENNCYLTDWLNDFDKDYKQQGHRFTAYSAKDDFYYAVGQISVNNITDGWDIDENDPRVIRYSLGVQHEDPHNIEGLYIENSDAYSAMGRIFYSSSYEDTSAGVMAAPKLVKNTWGPVPFVLIAPESFSPKTPDGAFYDYWKETTVRVCATFSYSGTCTMIENPFGDDTYLGIIDKDGNYYIPAK